MKQFTLMLTVLLLILPLASAATTIKLTTVPGNDVYISIWDDEFAAQLKAPKKYIADINGQVQHSYDGTSSPFGVLVVVKYFGEEKYRERLGPYTVGGTIVLPDLLPDGYDPTLEEDDQETPATPAENITQTNITTTNNNTNETNLTGSAIQETETTNIISLNFLSSQTAKTAYFIIGGIAVIAIIVKIIIFTISRLKLSRSSSQYGMEPVKFSGKPKFNPSGDKYLDHIEREIENLDHQIDQYKKRSRLEDAQRRLEEKKRILEKMKRGENNSFSRNNREEQRFKKNESSERYSDEHEHKFKKRFY